MINFTRREDKIEISKYHALHLAELNKSQVAQKMRWIGGDQLITLGEGLREFKSIETLDPQCLKK